MMAVPPALLEELQLQVGMAVGLETDGERLVVLPQRRVRYTLEELLMQSDAAAPMSADEREWLDLAPAGREL
jgi:antitoxin component of MazEF toxin-antitoxin module